MCSVQSSGRCVRWTAGGMPAPTVEPIIGIDRDRAFGSDDQDSAFGVGAGRVEGECPVFFCRRCGEDRRAGGNRRRNCADDEDSLRWIGFTSNFLPAVSADLSVCDRTASWIFGHKRRRRSRRADVGERPGLATIFGEGQVGAVVSGCCISAGDNAVVRRGRRWRRFRRSRGREDWGVVDLPGLSAVGGVEDTSGLAPGSEPDVGVGAAEGREQMRCTSSRRRRLLRLRLRQEVAQAGWDARFDRRR